MTCFVKRKDAIFARLQRVSPTLGLGFETPLDPFVVLGSLLGVESSIENDDSLSSDEDRDDGESDRDEDKTASELV